MSKLNILYIREHLLSIEQEYNRGHRYSPRIKEKLSKIQFCINSMKRGSRMTHEENLVLEGKEDNPFGLTSRTYEDYLNSY